MEGSFQVVTDLGWVKSSCAPIFSRQLNAVAYEYRAK
jgi:hypothetical protein